MESDFIDQIRFVDILLAEKFEWNSFRTENHQLGGFFFRDATNFASTNIFGW